MYRLLDDFSFLPKLTNLRRLGESMGKDYTDIPLGKRGFIMSDVMKFSDREAFRNWLTDHCMSNVGVWLLFGKAGGPKTIKAGEALEEALCFGWIDGQMQSIDEKPIRNIFLCAGRRASGQRKIGLGPINK